MMTSHRVVPLVQNPGLLRTAPLWAVLSSIVTPAFAAAANAVSTGARQPAAVSVGPGLSWVVSENTVLRNLTLAPGAFVTAPAGRSVTLTVNGVETGLGPGSYRGDIRLTLTDQNVVNFNETISHHFRQALYLDASGVVKSKSILSAAGNYTLAGADLSGVRIHSVGENFNGVYVSAGDFTLRGADIQLTGNGGNDFAGYGAAVMASGAGARLVVDGAKIRTQGVVRTAAVADKGAQLIVKNSDLQALAGTLPRDYVPNTGLGTMKNVPWLLGLSGNNRATNLLGENSNATYIASRITAQEWGVLSVDLSHNAKLTAINSQLRITGASGYGTYAIGDSTNRFYGSSIVVPDYAAIVTGGHVLFAASTADNVAQLNDELKLGLSVGELAALPRQPSRVQSKRFGVMIWGDATVDIRDDTHIETAQAIFLIKHAKARIAVDGAGGAQLLPKNGVILQLMDSDNSGPVVVDGQRLTTSVYREPQEPPQRIAAFDVGSPAATDVQARFDNIALVGDFYNSVRGGIMPPREFGPPLPPGRNLVLEFAHSQLSGTVTSSTARHAVATITPLEWRRLGEVTNIPAPAVNNGIIVTLDHSTWTVTGTSYLTRLTLDAASEIRAPAGRRVTMTIDGTATALVPGTYAGNLVLGFDHWNISVMGKVALPRKRG